MGISSGLMLEETDRGVGCLVSIALIAIVVRFGCKAVIDRFDIEILNWFNVGLSFRN